MTTFKVGDRVEWCGVEGVVSCVEGFNIKYPIEVSFGTRRNGTFTKDGKEREWHKEPSLKLLPAKKKVMLWRHWYYNTQGEMCNTRSTNDWDYFQIHWDKRYKHIRSTIVEEFEIDE